jgi:hypothetical protein
LRALDTALNEERGAGPASRRRTAGIRPRCAPQAPATPRVRSSGPCPAKSRPPAPRQLPSSAPGPALSYPCHDGKPRSALQGQALRPGALPADQVPRPRGILNPCRSRGGARRSSSWAAPTWT